MLKPVEYGIAAVFLVEIRFGRKCRQRAVFLQILLSYSPKTQQEFLGSVVQVWQQLLLHRFFMTWCAELLAGISGTTTSRKRHCSLH